MTSSIAAAAEYDWWVRAKVDVSRATRPAIADPNFPRRPSTRVTGALELVAHENCIVYFGSG